MALVTRADVKTWLGLSGEADDPFLGLAIEAVEAGLQRALNRQLESQVYTEYLSGTGLSGLYLPQRPVTAVSSVQILDGPRGAVLETLTAGTHFNLIDSRAHERNMGHLEMVSPAMGAWGDCRSIWPRGVANIKVVFTAGYTAETCPADLKMAIYQMIAVARASRADGMLHSDESLGDYSYSLATGNGLEKLPTGILATLARYREVVI